MKSRSGTSNRLPKRSAFDELCAPTTKKRCAAQLPQQGWTDLGRQCTVGYFPRHLDKQVSDASFQVRSLQSLWHVIRSPLCGFV